MNVNSSEAAHRNAGGVWRPLLEGAARDAAFAAVADIAQVAASAIREWSETHRDGTGINMHSLACGRAGAALFYAYCAACEVVPDADTVAIELIEEAIEATAECAPDASLFCGFTGVAWVTEHLGRMAGAGDAAEPSDERGEEDDPNGFIDETLLEYLRNPQAETEYDLIDGLTGIGVYALERMPRAGGHEILSRVVGRLREMMVDQPGGAAWETPLARYVRHGLPPGSQGLFNLGLAHGQPGPIALLAHAIRRGIAVPEAAGLLDSAAPWLLGQRFPPGAISRFPGHAGPDVEPEPARCAWCYGDPGVAVALLSAARATGRPDWEAEAVELARYAAARRAQRSDVRDAGMCHGSAGVGHIFNRVFQATGDEEFGVAARYWFDRALGQRVDGGLGGFRTWSLERSSEGEWIDDPRFLTGITGTGLALLAAATGVEPAWDRIMLTDVPPRAGRES